MTITAALASMTVTDLDRAGAWYAALLGRGPDARPMDGLLEWHLPGGSGVQVWSEPDRAGRSGVTLAVDDLDAVARALTASRRAARRARAGHVEPDRAAGRPRREPGGAHRALTTPRG